MKSYFAFCGILPSRLAGETDHHAHNGKYFGNMQIIRVICDAQNQLKLSKVIDTRIGRLLLWRLVPFRFVCYVEKHGHDANFSS